ncbi:unnamed protein product, partial [Owenia fusiformis]
TCKQCPEGYYCMANSTDFTSQECPTGHFCPNGTASQYENPCPPGTYNALPRGTSETDCQDCQGGEYCEGQGNSAATGNCSAGWFCSGGADRPNTTTHGGECQPGYYCPEGSMSPIPCPGGEFCATSGLATPTGLCSAGHYCTLKAISATPSGDSTGDICPPGYYCPEQSSYPIPCSPGTYSPSSGNMNITDCLACSLGEYCASYNLTQTTGNCSAGFYCPQGEITDNPHPCPMGYYCPEATYDPFICDSGWYQDNTGQSDCKLCPEGYYCDNSNGAVVINETVTCPAGFFCPPGTKRADQWPCPLGTFGNDTGYNDSSNCSPCLGGMYCGIVGQTWPTGYCKAGYFCHRYAEIASPNQTTDANICPEGSYCLEGTDNPSPCPVGTFGAIEGLRNSSECTPCTAGKYCDIQGITSVTVAERDCYAGYYCEEGSTVARQALCTPGHFCPTGSDIPTRCPEGTFNPYWGLNSTDQCTPCTQGQYCDTEGMNVTSGPCEAGYYCPPGQNSSRPTDYPCPVAYYCPVNSSEPLPCQNGTYMNHTHAEVCDICPEGWYCTSGDLVQLCPEGYYCPEGTGVNWIPCPRGTFSNETGLAREDQCESCLGGSYCETLRATAPKALCSAGYYCEYGTDRATPTNGNATLINGTCQVPGGETGVGGVCPEGSYCPIGTTTPLPCGAGTYSNVTGLATCYQCPAGYYCLDGDVTFMDTPCPEGHYCLAGTSSPSQYPCPPGTYFNTTGAQTIDDCIACPGGYYCEIPGLAQPTGLCDPGWYCTLNSSSAQSVTEGGECQPGFYCPQGAYAPIQCDPGTYCEITGLDAPTGNCTAGYYCVLESSTATPTDNTTGAECPLGHYC